MHPIKMNSGNKVWIASSILVLLVSVAVFAFRERISETIVLWAVILTPIVLLMLALLFWRSNKDA